MDLTGRRLGDFSLKARRLFVGLALIPFLLSVLNHYLQWHLVGRFDNVAVAVASVVLFLVMRYLGPTVEELKRYREAERSAR